MEMIESLRGHLLIASPELKQDQLTHSVVYICEQQSQGMVGLIINKPSMYSLGFMFELLNIESHDTHEKERPLLYGGPVQNERGFVLHRPPGTWRSSLVLDNDVTMTTSSDIIHALAHHEGPKDVLVLLGFMAWNNAQLEKELRDDYWLVGSATPELLYETPFDQRWEQAMSILGVGLNQLVLGGGRA